MKFPITKNMLWPGEEIRFKDGRGVDFSVLQKHLQKSADEVACPVGFCMDELKDPGLGTLFAGTPCLVMFCPDKKGRPVGIRFVFTIRYSGTYAFITINKTNKTKYDPEEALHHVSSDWETIAQDIIDDLKK